MDDKDETSPHCPSQRRLCSDSSMDDKDDEQGEKGKRWVIGSDSSMDDKDEILSGRCQVTYIVQIPLWTIRT